jgi:hypothetical protein
VRLEHIFDEEAYGVLAQVGGDVAEAQGTVLERHDSRTRTWAAGTSHRPLAPGASLRKSLSIGHFGIVLEAGEDVAADRRMVGEAGQQCCVEPPGFAVVTRITSQVGEVGGDPVVIRLVLLRTVIHRTCVTQKTMGDKKRSDVEQTLYVVGSRKQLFAQRPHLSEFAGCAEITRSA